jgi:purine nucleoside permease
MARLICNLLVLNLLARSAEPIPVKVVVVAMFERGEDTGDQPGEFQLWVEREHLDRVFEMPGAYHRLRMNGKGVLGTVTGVGTAKAAASIMALGMDRRFDLTKAYWLVAGIGGGDPQDVSLGSAVWAEHVIDGDLGYEIDSREIPKDWPTGMVPLRKTTPYEQPLRPELEGEAYTLNKTLVDWAFALTKSVPLDDSEKMQAARGRFQGFPNALRPPFITKGDDLSASTFWHGALMDTWANDWVKYYTRGTGNYMVCGMEDTGTLQALTFLGKAGLVDPQRLLVLRTVSNYDRQAPGTTASESLRTMTFGAYSAYLPALEAAQKTGSVVVHYLTDHWDEVRDKTPQAR